MRIDALPFSSQSLASPRDRVKKAWDEDDTSSTQAFDAVKSNMADKMNH
jgi:hypothetical protein